ncbi:hypothetical protein ABIA95_005404 [Bradyrhizobium sp. LA8.1]
MTKDVQKITLSPSRDIPFNKLVLRQSNIRRFKAGISIEKFANSITHRSLLQSLNVWPIVEAVGNETVMFEVPAEGRLHEDKIRTCTVDGQPGTGPCPRSQSRTIRTMGWMPPSSRRSPFEAAICVLLFAL